MIIVDTSVLIEFLKGKGTVSVEKLRQLEEKDVPFFVPVICCQEVLQGARNAREWSGLVKLLEGQNRLWPKEPWDSHLAAARIFYDCRRKGLTIRSTIDCLIAQIVLENDGVLLHDDEDYERIKAVRPLRTLLAGE